MKRFFAFAANVVGRSIPTTVPLRASSSLTDASSLRYWGTGLLNNASPIQREARIVSLSDPHDDANSALHAGELPEGAKLLAIGTSFDEFDIESLKEQEPNVLFVSHPMARQPLVQLLEALPTVEWVHTRSAGIDFVTSPGLAESSVYVTNAKGQFSSTLAEYCMMACSYFAKVSTGVQSSECVRLAQPSLLSRICLVLFGRRVQKFGESTTSSNFATRLLALLDTVTLDGLAPSLRTFTG